MTIAFVNTDSAPVTDRASELTSKSEARAAMGAWPGAQLIGLADSNPRVQAAALTAFGRVMELHPMKPNAKEDGKATVAGAILPLTKYDPTEFDGDAWRSPEPARVIPHLAVQTLVRMNAVQPCLNAINTPYQSGALWALKYMHSTETVDGLFQALAKATDSATRNAIWTTLIRLYHKEGDFTMNSPKWWGTRPDTTGPYYHRTTWSESERIAAAVKVALADSEKPLADHIQAELKKHVVKLDGLDSLDVAAMKEPHTAIKITPVDPNNPNQIANMKYADVVKQTLDAKGDAKSGKQLFNAQACINCHTFANGQRPKGPHLVDIGKRYKANELVESIVTPNKKIAQGFDTWTFIMESGKTHAGFVVSESAETVTMRQADGLSKELLQDDIDDRVKQDISMMPKGVAGNLTPQQLADLIAYLQTLR